MIDRLRDLVRIRAARPRRCARGGARMKPVLVLGTPCTGTAEVAVAIRRLGASLGRPGSLGKSGENKPLRLVNQALLAALGGDWDCPPELHQG